MEYLLIGVLMAMLSLIGPFFIMICIEIISGIIEVVMMIVIGLCRLFRRCK